MIKLFDHSATEFSTMGLGALVDATRCEVSEERNGPFELELDYPIKGRHFSDLAFHNIIYAKPNPFSDAQAFRIYQISKPINGVVTVNAQHISYDLSGCVASPFTVQGLGNALNGLKEYSVPSHNFNFSTDKDSADQEFKVLVPTSVRSLLGGMEGSLLDIYGTGEYEFDNYDVRFKLHRGSDRGVHIRYGKNLTDLQQDENCSNVYTAVYPYWAGTVYDGESSSDVIVTLDEQLVQVEGTFPYTKILPLNLSEKFQNEQPTQDQLREAAAQYITDNKIGEPKVSLKVSFVQLAQYKEYELLRDLERISLCDTVTVDFLELGVNSTAKCIKTVYNVLTDKYTSIELGESRTSLVSTVTSQAEEIANAPTESEIAEAIKQQTKLITGGLGGYVILHNSTGQDHPDELLILEEASGGRISKAQKLWRWNFGGLGFSKNGYNGPYEDISITMDGKLHATTVFAEGIKAGVITASLTIIAPVIQNSVDNPTFQVDGEGNIKGANIKGSTFGNATGTFSVDANGNIKGAVITGSTLQNENKTVKINSDGATIGPWTVNSSGFENGSNAWLRPNLIACGQAGGTLLKLVGGSSGDTSGYFWITSDNVDDGLKIFVNGGIRRSGSGGYSWAVFEGDSDERLKTNIINLDVNSIRELFQLVKPVQFTFKSDQDDILQYGMVAQQLLQALQDSGLNPDSIITSPSKDFLHIEYNKLHGFEFAGIQDLYNRVNILEDKVNELTNNNQ